MQKPFLVSSRHWYPTYIVIALLRYPAFDSSPDSFVFFYPFILDL